MRKRSLRGVGRYRFSALCGRSAFAWRGKRKANAPFDAQDKEAQRTPRFAEKMGEVAHCFVARTAKNGCPTVAVQSNEPPLPSSPRISAFSAPLYPEHRR